MILFLDVETFNERPIRDGSHRYAETVEIMVWSWAIDDGEPQVWDATAGGPMPAELKQAIKTAETIVFHNSTFDRTQIRHATGYAIEPERIHDTMVQALSHGLPGGLDKLSEIFQLGDKSKDKAGRQLIQLFCRPPPKTAKRGRATRLTHPVEWQRFLDYAKQDIVPMRELFRKIPKWNYAQGNEGHRLWCLDQCINDRGYKVDQDLAAAAVETVKAHKKILDKRTQALTDDEIRSTTQRDEILRHLLAEYGVDLPDLQSGTIERRLEDPDLPPAVKELLANRLVASTTTASKYNTLLRAVSSDGRLRGTLQFCGAPRTKRWSGKIFQPQNLIRPAAWFDADEQAQAIAVMKAGAAHLIYDEPIEVANYAVRGCIVADEGKKLVVSDLEQIEARTLPWLAGEEWKVDVFRRYDAGEGYDVYTVTAAKIRGKHPSEVTKDERQAYGKVVELACLSEGTLVLTARGDVPIEKVLPGDYVWDGNDWVRTDGAIYKGEREVIEYDGLCATADHLVWVERQADPIEFGRAAADGFRLLRARAPDKIALSQGRKTTDCRQAALHQSQRQGLEELWSERRAIQLCHRCASLCLGTGEFGASAERDGAGSDRQQRPLRTGQSALVDESGQPIAHAANQADLGAASLSAAISECALCRLYPSQSAVDGAELRADSRALGATELQTKRHVWDLLNCGPLHRFTASGRLVHNCGYGGAAGAFAQFAKIYGVNLPDWEIYEIVREWRLAHPALCDWDSGFWTQLDTAAREAILNPGRICRAGEHIAFERWKNWLKMHLPSGGFLSYAAPAIAEDPRRPGQTSVCFMGLNNYTKRWERIFTYGGKLSADATQTTAREVLASNLPAVEEAGFEIELLVHDETVTEAPDDVNYSVDKLNAIVARNAKWNAGLPLAADGFEAYRYRK